MPRRLPPLVDAAALHREPMSRCPTMKKPFSRGPVMETTATKL
ncbi:hypothetical protein OROGR_032809 [Orobanche gracilis]